MTPQWDLFLLTIYEYLKENWPDWIGNESFSAFVVDYEKSLIERYNAGDRGLFLFYSADDRVVGLANAYIANPLPVLNIAEFYVASPFRKIGVGTRTQMKNFLIQWGIMRSAVEIRVEVDKDLENANRFWSRFFQCDNSTDRNVYRGTIR